MTAMLDHLVQQRVVFQVNGRWSMTVPVDSVDPGVPETLKQMLEMQLRHASDAEQQLLKCASVAGQRFTIWSVATMLGEDPSTIEAMCEALADRQQFLKPSGDRSLCDGASTAEFQFRHALYREVIYRRLTPTQRRAFHLRLAEGFEALRCPVVPEMAAEAALHFEEGQDYERAVQYLMVGAQNATRRYAHQQAVEVLEHAQGLLPRLPPDRTRALDFQLLERIGNAYYALGDMDRSACAYASIATHAAEDGLLLERAEALMRLSHPAESIPFFLRAVEIDPNFATAYVSLSRIYSNVGESGEKAVRSPGAVNERDGSITYQYHYEVTGDQARASGALAEWKQAFPSAFQPANSLAVMHNFLGDFERAVAEGQEAVRRDPSHGYPYSNLAHAYRGLGRFDDARATAARAVELGVETLPTRRLLYQLAILAGDDEAAARHFEWARDRPREFDMIGARAQAAAWSGRVADARVFYENAARMAELRHLPDVATNHLAWATSMEIAYGNLDRAGRLARRVLDRRPSYDPRLRAALALALGGSPGEAETLANELSTTYPAHTLINLVLVPIVRSGIELGRARPECALDRLRVVAPYELGFIAALAPIHLRPQSYLMLGLGQQAADEFQRLLDHRGSDSFSPFVAVAPWGLPGAGDGGGRDRQPAGLRTGLRRLYRGRCGPSGAARRAARVRSSSHRREGLSGLDRARFSGARPAATQGRRVVGCEHGPPLVLHAHDRPVLPLGEVERRLRAVDIGEFARVVVVQQQQAQRRAMWTAGEPQHLDIAVRVAEGQNRPPPDAAPDPHGLDRPIVEDIRLRQIEDGAAVLIAQIAQRIRTADHALGRHAVDVGGHRAHEVAIAGRHDEVREPVAFEIPQQLHHRLVAAVAIRTVETGMPAVGEELPRAGRVLVNGHALERLQQSGKQHLQVRLIPVMVLGDALATSCSPGRTRFPGAAPALARPSSPGAG